MDSAWKSSATNVIQFVAFGGVGRSVLVAHWLRQMEMKQWDGPACVFGYSFFSQGSRSDSRASADAFLNSALVFFGDKVPDSGTPWDRGERLAELVRRQPTLLILDGVEPLQYPSTTEGTAGEFRDAGLAALVRELARDNNGLCVITTRAAVRTIEDYVDSTVQIVNLESLSPVAGAALLEQLGVRGTSEELRQASDEVRGHGLALSLLGNYLRELCGGDIRQRSDIGLLDEELDEEQGGHARRMMERYERWLSGEIEVEGHTIEVKHSGRLSHELLRLMGLFNRPMTAGELAVLCQEEAIPGLTDALSQASNRMLTIGVLNLEQHGLMLRLSDEPLARTPRGSVTQGTAILDCHPLVREHFANRLEQGDANIARAAHRRLYEYSRDLTSGVPQTLEEVIPLCHAIAHGCAAELYDETFRDVCRDRFMRNDTRWLFEQSGVASSLAVSLRSFFAHTSRSDPCLSDVEDQVQFVVWYCYCLAATRGFAPDVVKPWFQKAVQMAGKQRMFKESFVALAGLFHCDQFRGELNDAMKTVERLEGLASQAAQFGSASAPAMTATAKHARAETELYRGQFAASDATADAFLASARETEPSFMEVDTGVALLSFRAWCNAYQGHAVAAIEHCERAVGRAKSLKARLAFGIAHYHAALMYYELGDPDEVERHAAELRRLGIRTNWSFWNALAKLSDAFAAKLLGRFEDAEFDLVRGVELWQRTARRGMTRFNCMLAELRLQLGREREAADALASAFACQNWGEDLYLAEMQRISAQILCRDPSATRDRIQAGFSAAIATAQSQGAMTFELRSALAFAQWRIAGGEETAAIEQLTSVYNRCDRTYETKDLRIAGEVLAAKPP